MSGVLLIGNLRSSLPLARALSRAGYEVHCGVDEPDPYLFTSRHIHGWFQHALVAGHAEPLLSQVEAYLATHPGIAALVPVSDNAARLFSAHRARFDGRVVLAVANQQAVEACIDKAGSFQLCDQLNVPVAPRRIVQDYSGLQEAVGAIGLPCVVKPVDASEFIFDRKALILRTPAEVEAGLPFWPPGHVELCVQRFVGGYRHDVLFAASRGRLLGAVDARIVRNNTADGSGYAVEMVSEAPSAVVRRALPALAEALNYHGVGALQFMIDPATGEATFLEINPRLSACYRVAEVCGLPLSRLIVEIAAGEAPEPPADPWTYAVGRRVAWTKGDLAGLKHQLAAGALTAAAAARWATAMARGAFRRHHLTFDPTDPAPTAWIYLHPLLRRLGFAGRRHGFPARGASLNDHQQRLVNA